MIKQQVRKSGNSYVVTIPKSEIERLNISDGQMDITPLEYKPVLPPDLKEIVNEIREDSTPVMQYLRDK
jgi:hypothetical protein